MIYYMIISKAIWHLIAHTGNDLDYLILVVVLAASSVLWLLGLYGKLKDRR